LLLIFFVFLVGNIMKKLSVKMDGNDVCCKPKFSPRPLFLTPQKNCRQKCVKFERHSFHKKPPCGTFLEDPQMFGTQWGRSENKDFFLWIDLKAFSFKISELSVSSKNDILCIHILIEFHIITKWEGRNLRRAADVDAGHELGFTRQEVWTIGHPVKLLFGNCPCLENFHLSVQMLGALAWATCFSF